jgi:nucleotide-binding universal stress UspA family protein
MGAAENRRGWQKSEGAMFKRVLLCYDGSAAGRKALKRGAELAKLLNAQVCLLSVLPEGVHSAAVWAVAAGAPCLIDPVQENASSVRDSVQYLKELGVDAQVFQAHGNVIDEIAACAQKTSADLVVVGHYPKPTGGRWWSGSERGALAERVNCCVLIAVSDQ